MQCKLSLFRGWLQLLPIASVTFGYVKWCNYALSYLVNWCKNGNVVFTQVCAYENKIQAGVYVYVCIYVDVKIVVRVKSIMEVVNNVSQGHSLLNFWQWLQALAFFPCVQLIASFSLFWKSLGKTKYTEKNPGGIRNVTRGVLSARWSWSSSISCQFSSSLLIQIPSIVKSM